MTKEEKEQKNEQFVAWITFIDDRVDEWKAGIPASVAAILNYKVDSLNAVESYFLENFTRDDLKDQSKKHAIDAIVSYLGETIRLNLPEAKWFIDLDDEDNVNFNTPVIRVSVGPEISPFTLVRWMLLENTGDFLTTFYQERLGFINNPDTLLS